MCGHTLARVSATIPSRFADRLAEVCVDLGLPAGRGLYTSFARMFGVTPNAARKWLNGTGMPELARVVAIAARARVNVSWLLQGYGPKRAGSERQDLGRAVADAIDVLPHQVAAEVVDYLIYRVDRAAPLIAREDYDDIARRLQAAKGSH